MKRQNLRTVSLIVVTFTYLLVGAAIFGYLESDYEVRQRETLELIELIVKRKYNISDDDFTVLTTTVIKSVPHKAGIQWKFSGAFYFATTVVTTIGYGHSTPATVAGRSFCMVYALIGIPLGLVMFQSIGERLNTFVGAALRHAKRCFKAANPEVTQTNLVMVVSVLSTILMTSMAAVFAKYERWDYFDALYYCFITLTTIGFGDYVALQKESALQSKPEYVALSLIFILFGLSVVSSAVNLLVLKFLTLNTEDERRDEQLRYTATLNPIQLEGDIITSGRKPRPNGPAGAAPGRPAHGAPPGAGRGGSSAGESARSAALGEDEADDDDEEEEDEEDEDEEDEDEDEEEEEDDYDQDDEDPDDHLGRHHHSRRLFRPLAADPASDADDELDASRALRAGCQCAGRHWAWPGRSGHRARQQVAASSPTIYVIADQRAWCAARPEVPGAQLSSGTTCSCTESPTPRATVRRRRANRGAWLATDTKHVEPPVARLVCKCCCQHLECVQFAIRQAEPRTSGPGPKSEPEAPSRLGLQIAGRQPAQSD